MRAVVISLLIATAAGAQPSDFTDSAAKISAILADPAVAEAVHHAPIAKVEETGIAPDGADLWMVMVQECDLTVRVLHTAPPPGYRVEVTEPCR